jgi:hypothetical protein
MRFQPFELLKLHKPLIPFDDWRKHQHRQAKITQLFELIEHIEPFELKKPPQPQKSQKPPQPRKLFPPFFHI